MNSKGNLRFHNFIMKLQGLSKILNQIWILICFLLIERVKWQFGNKQGGDARTFFAVDEASREISRMLQVDASWRVFVVTWWSHDIFGVSTCKIWSNVTIFWSCFFSLQGCRMETKRLEFQNLVKKVHAMKIYENQKEWYQRSFGFSMFSCF